MRAMANSPTYIAGIHDHSVAMVNPAQLAWGLRRACLEVGVRLYERTQVTALAEKRDLVFVKTHYGQVKAKRVALAPGWAVVSFSDAR